MVIYDSPLFIDQFHRQAEEAWNRGWNVLLQLFDCAAVSERGSIDRSRTYSILFVHYMHT